MKSIRTVADGGYVCFMRLVLYYRIAGYFRRVFIFGYFKEAFFCENKFPGPTVIQKCILTIKLNACLDSRDYIIFAAQMHFVAISSGCQI